MTLKAVASYTHTEAFCLMWYACQCGHRERIWNSRDGVTPFGGLRCTSCGKGGIDGGMRHVDWKLDACSPNHKLVPGQQFFRDGTAEDAVAIVNCRLACMVKGGHKVPPDAADRARKDAEGLTGEWKKGWPMTDRQPEAS